MPTAVPDPPTSVTVKPGLTSAVVSWLSPVNSVGAQVTGYSVSVTPAVSPPIGCINTTKTSCVFSGLTSATQYIFTVVALNQIGSSVAATSDPISTLAGIVPLAHPLPLTPLVPSVDMNQGLWTPTGRVINGEPTILKTYIRLSNNSFNRASVAWIDTALLRAQLYSGSFIPGGNFWQYKTPISAQGARTLDAAFNGGFQIKDAHGGYFSEGKTVKPLVNGAASLVINTDGSVTIGSWGQSVSMSSSVKSVMQNLRLLISNGVPSTNLQSNDVSFWGGALNSISNVPRSAIGQTSTGALVYVEGKMNVVQLVKVLVSSGAVNAMELDINPTYPFFVSYSICSKGCSANSSNGQMLSSEMGSLKRIFDPYFNRDFVTLSVR